MLCQIQTVVAIVAVPAPASWDTALHDDSMSRRAVADLPTAEPLLKHADATQAVFERWQPRGEEGAALERSGEA